MTRFLPAVWCACLAAAVAAAPADDPKPTDADRLVQQLGAARHADREAAARALDALGPAALPALREGVKSSDPEVRRRAGELLAKQERRAESAAALAATKVHVKAADAPLADVVRDLERQSKVRILLAREPVDLPARRVTVDTGPTSFWEALAAVCRTAKVSIRPGTLDPAPADDAAGGLGVAVPAAPAVVQNAAGGVVVFSGTSLAPADEPLVLQDGALPEYPTAYLGAVRVRLIPDRWANRDRKPGDEVRWTLEILTEPRVRWLTPPSFRFDTPPGVRADATPQAGDPAAGGAVPRRAAGGGRVMVGGPGGVRVMGGEAVRGPARLELPVYVKADAGAAIPELKGLLAGMVQAPPGMVVAIPDVTKEKASAVGKDGTKLTIRDYERADDGAVTLKVEAERPGGGVAVGNAVMARNVRVIGAGGAVPANVARLINGTDGSEESFKLADDKGRPYAVVVTRSEVHQGNGGLTVTLTLACRPAAADAQPRALELHGPRQAGVEAVFTLRHVPAPG
ncbi:MAG TPA: HEAT repeat domain-containing protein [Gemmataceae bacterium]|jgi:hypothetical protein